MIEVFVVLVIIVNFLIFWVEVLGGVSIKYSVFRARVGCIFVIFAVLGLAFKVCIEMLRLEWIIIVRWKVLLLIILVLVLMLIMIDCLGFIVIFCEVLFIWLRMEIEAGLFDRLERRRWREVSLYFGW